MISSEIQINGVYQVLKFWDKVYINLALFRSSLISQLLIAGLPWQKLQKNSEVMLVGFKLDTVELINVSTCCLSPFTVTEPDEDVEEADDIYGSVVIGGPSAPSWTDIPPPSLFGKEDEPLTTSPRVSPRKTPVTSPAKSSGMSLPSDSPSKVKI